MSASPTCFAHETHLSRLFFTPDRVYKLLKPVVLPFVDFSEDGDRCAAATQEYLINHAIAPDVYLGVADVVEDGSVVDRMIVMRRLADGDQLTNVLGSADEAQALAAVGRHVAALHAAQPALEGARAEPASIDSVAKNWDDNFAVIGEHVGTVIDPGGYHEMVGLAQTYLAGREPLFRWRMDRGWIRDGHGDLRCEHVFCTPDGPRLIDCVAFDERLRVSDVLADVAFLAMDLHRLAGPHAAVAMMAAWIEHTNEHHPSSLAHFYVAYRAHVRCKIACLNHAAGMPEALDDARIHHDLALSHLRLARPHIVIVGGGPGAGKSTVAEGVAGAIGAAWLRSDEVRKDIAGLAHDEHAFAEVESGIYSRETTERTHRELARQAEVLISRGFSVVLDATWSRDSLRVPIREIAAAHSARLTEIQCSLPASIAKERIARRMASVHNPSDATPDLVDHFAATFERWSEATMVRTDQPVHDTIAEAVRIVAGRPIDQEMTPRFVDHVELLRRTQLQILAEYGLGSA